MDTELSNNKRIIRLKEVMHRVSLSRSAVLARVARGDMPAPILLGVGRSVGFIESEIDEWLEQRIADAKTAAANKPKKKAKVSSAEIDLMASNHENNQTTTRRG